MTTAEAPATESDLFTVIRTQRAMRRLKPDPVPEELIKQILWAATRAPNGGNRQPWRFLVITEPATKKRLQELYHDAWEQYAKAGYTGPQGLSPEAQAANDRVVRSAQYLADHMHEAPVLILACAFGQGPNQGIAAGSSIYPAIQNLMLAARALGLGTALTTLHRWHEPEVRELLGIPETVDTAALIPVGWPKGKFGEGPRQPVEAVTYWEKWGVKRP
jgi:nitroreductase